MSLTEFNSETIGRTGSRTPQVDITRGGNFLVTAGLPYSNGNLHVGHIAGAYLPADIFVRFLKLLGQKVRSVCGSDDHGVAIVATSQSEGKTPREVASFYNQKQRQVLEGLGISFDIFSATSQNRFHAPLSQEFFLRLYQKGFFEKISVEQFYDTTKEIFLPDRFVKGTCGYCGAEDQNGDQCEECGQMLDSDSLKNPRSALSNTPAVLRNTTHWFLDLARFEPVVQRWLGNALIREDTRTYVSGILGQGLIKRCMTRDLDWGIPVPLDDSDAKGKVLYVWFDAPVGYISNTMELSNTLNDSYGEWWKGENARIFHFIGEDNTIFHTIIWIAMLAAHEGYALPEGVVVNKYMNVRLGNGPEEKMSKSRGTAIWVQDYLDQGGNADTLRYYLTAVAPETGRAIFRGEDLVTRNNSELANVLGNFVNRVLSFTTTYIGGVMPECDPSKLTQTDIEFSEKTRVLTEQIKKLMLSFQFRSAQEHCIQIAREGNRYLGEKKPWMTRTSDQEATKITMALALNSIKTLSITLSPFMPGIAGVLAQSISMDPTCLKWEDALTPLNPGSSLRTPQILFGKMEKAPGVPG